MKNYLLDSDGDLYIAHGKSFFLEGDSALSQNLDTNLRTNKGEIFTDSEIGLPLITLMTKSVTDAIKVTIIKSKILSLEYVDEITYFSYTRDMENRKLNIKFTAKITTEFGGRTINYNNGLEV